MQLTEKIYSDIRKVKFIYGNKLHTHFVSHEETYSPDDNDGDFVEPQTFLICFPTKGKHNKPGGLMDYDCKQPKIIIPKESVLIVEKA